MNINVTGRRLTVADGIREYAEKKIEKLEVYFNQSINVHVILDLGKIDRTAEVIVSGDGVRYHGKEKGETFFAAIDMLVEKIDKQIIRYKERNQTHKGPRNDIPSSLLVFGTESDEPESRVKLVEVSGKPQDRIEAYLQMKIDKKDFSLFKQGVSEVNSEIDFSNKRYAIICKTNGQVKMTEIPFEFIKEQNFDDEGAFIEYALDIKDDSPIHPDIDFKRTGNAEVMQMTLTEAITELQKNGTTYLPFFNLESEYLNILYKDGKDLAVLMPALS